MNSDLLQTKFRLPLLPPSCLSRDHLLSRLNAALYEGGVFRRRLTLIAAPAGYGKTTLAACWIEERIQCGAWHLPGETPAGSKPVLAWLSLDADDHQPAQFFRYLLAALQGADQLLAKHLPAAEPSLLEVTPREVAKAVVNAFDSLRRPLVLALDDYHHGDGGAAAQTLSFILNHQPRNLHLLLTSRSEPRGLPLSRLRASQQMLTLDQEDLRFTKSESRAFLQSRIRRTLSPADLETVAQPTAGWAGGLQLAALVLQRHRGEEPLDMKSALGTDNRHLSDYLATEVLGQLPTATEQFLLQSSILERLCEPLCRAVLTSSARRAFVDGAEGQSLLGTLAAEGFFLTRLDAQDCWYRYHELFAAFLRQRLQENQPQLVPQLQRRAAEWHRENGSPHDAVRHAVASGDEAYALNVIDGYTPWLLERGELTTLIAWLEPISPSNLLSCPTTALNLAWAYLIQGEPERAAALAATLEPRLKGSQQEDLLAMHIAAARRRGDISAARRYARKARSLQASEQKRNSGVIDLYLADLHVGSGEIAQARRLITQALQTFRAHEQPFLETQALFYLINVHVTQGQLQEAAALCREALALMERHRLPYRVGGFHNRLGLIHWEWGHLQEAEAYLQEATEIARRSERVPFFVSNALLLATVWRDMGRDADVERLLQEVRQRAARAPCALAQFSQWQAQTALREGQPMAATQWLSAQGLSPGDEPDYFAIEDYLLLAKLLIAQGESAHGRQLLRRLLSLARQIGDTSAQIEVLLALARLYHEGRRSGLAIRMLQEALAVGSLGGYVQRFVHARTAIGPLLARVGEMHPPNAVAPFSTEYVRRLLAACDVELPASLIDPSFTLAEDLSPRELEILQLLAGGLSNPEIAARLHISVGTVRWHVKNVYKKLDVNNRVQATRRAQALDLT